MCFRVCACECVWVCEAESEADSETDSALVWGDAPDCLSFPAKIVSPSHLLPFPPFLIPPPLPLLLLHLLSSILSLGFIQSVLTFDPPSPVDSRGQQRPLSAPPTPTSPLSLWLEEDEGRDRLQKQKEKEKQVLSVSSLQCYINQAACWFSDKNSCYKNNVKAAVI